MTQDKLERQRAELEQKHAEQAESAMAAKTQVNQLELEVARLSTIRDEIQLNHENLLDLYKQTCDENTKLQKEQLLSQQQLSGLQLKNERLSAELKEVREAFTATNEELTTSNQFGRNLQKQNADLWEEKDKMAKTADELEIKLYESQHRAGQLEAKMKRLQREMQGATKRLRDCGKNLQTASNSLLNVSMWCVCVCVCLDVWMWRIFLFYGYFCYCYCCRRFQTLTSGKM